jgi:hypothetical protein
MSFTSVHRRKILLLGPSVVATQVVGLLTFPRIASAQTGAEAAVVDVIVKAAGVISKLLGSQGGGSDDQWRKEVAASLRRIEVKVDRLLREVRELRVQFNEDLSRRYLNEKAALYSAYRTRLETLLQLSRPLSRAEKSEIEQLIVAPEAGLLDSLVSFARLRDPNQLAYYPGFGLLLQGLGTLFLAMSVIDFDRKRAKPVVAAYLDDFLALCVDPKARGSFAFQLASEQQEQKRTLEWLEARGNNKTWLVGTIPVAGNPPPDGGDLPTAYFGARFTGSAESGYRYELVQSRQEYAPYAGLDAAYGTNRQSATRFAERIREAINSEASALKSSRMRARDLSSTVSALADVIVKLRPLA